MSGASNLQQFRSELEIKAAIEAAKGKVIVSDQSLTTSDLGYLKHGELRFDATNNRLIIRVGDKLLVSKFSESVRIVNEGKGSATSAGLNISFDEEMPTDDYVLSVQCFTDSTQATSIGFSVTSRTKTGFRLIPLEDCVYQYSVSAKS